MVFLRLPTWRVAALPSRGARGLNSVEVDRAVGGQGLAAPLKEMPLAGTQRKNFGGYFAGTRGRVSAKLKLLSSAKRKRSESEV